MDDQFRIDYQELLARRPTDDLPTLIPMLMEELGWVWTDAYRTMPGYPPVLLDIEVDGLHVIFDDFTREPDVPIEPGVNDRVVAVMALSTAPLAKRDTSRMQGFLRGVDTRVEREGVDGPEVMFWDRGHAIAHAAGGGYDINLYPQRRELNRGWSEEGKVFREMERYAAEHVGTLCFTRPIYTDRTWFPTAIEFGVLRSASDLWVERFRN